MKKLFIIFLFAGFLSKAQDFFIYKGDTINRADMNGLKQGDWIIFGKNKPGTCFKDSQVVERGKYLDNRKTGTWSEYYCNGNPRSKLTFKGGRPEGYAVMFHENGNVSEEGNWKANRWVGKYRQYDTSAVLIYEFEFNENGIREGRKTVYPVNDPVIEGKFCNGAIIKEYDSSGGYITTDQDDKSKPGNKDSLALNKTRIYNLNGQHTLYNSKKQITKDGVFKDNRLMDGKAYIYDENGILTRIAIYKDGKYTGDEAIDK